MSASQDESGRWFPKDIYDRRGRPIEQEVDEPTREWRGAGCPICGSDAAECEYDSIEIQDGDVFQKGDCAECGGHWTEEYSLLYADVHDADSNVDASPYSLFDSHVPHMGNRLIAAATAVVRDRQLLTPNAAMAHLIAALRECGVAL